MAKNYFRGTVSDNSHPIVKQIHSLMHAQHRSYSELAAETGYDLKSFYNMRRGSVPNIRVIDDILTVLGYKLVMIPNGSPSPCKDA